MFDRNTGLPFDRTKAAIGTVALGLVER